MERCATCKHLDERERGHPTRARQEREVEMRIDQLCEDPEWKQRFNELANELLVADRRMHDYHQAALTPGILVFQHGGVQLGKEIAAAERALLAHVRAGRKT